MIVAVSRKILVHCCCGPCSTSSIERLIEEGWEPVLYYGNSNIWPQEEYLKRFDNLEIVAEKYGLQVFCGEYDHNVWKTAIKGLENQPEHGKRCTECFRFNLKETSETARRLGIKHFTTTLTVSRFKNSLQIFEVGSEFEGFEKIDFKKKKGFERSIELSKDMGLYRQSYCGCEFSMHGNGKREGEY
ncbi:MAG: epoxyqueuosine reductase QueH [Sphaerochaetaceae bacterium]|nr:epoxyqueuosine reductase QueH [Sphaerochaetaceae bacterium]